MKYTTEQIKILSHNPQNHACILAGPGTGKSFIIIRYIEKIHKQSLDKKIKLLTFTRAANSELTDKIIEGGHEKVVSSTVHSFAITTLLGNPGSSGLPEPLRIADDWEWKELIRSDFKKKLSASARIIDKLKTEMSSSWESLSQELDEKIPAHLRPQFMGLWDEHRNIYGYTLLAELPFRLLSALEGNPDLSIGSLDLIAVDEYQDLNACDLKCIQKLTGYGITVIGIGDCDQSIYKFRKADPAGIRQFPADYNSVSYPLSISHRCGRKILEWANFVIEGDTSRPPKKPLKPSNKNPDGIVRYLVFNRESSEAVGIVQLIRWLNINQSIPLEEILILVRTGIVAKLIKECLHRENIPFSDPSEFLSLLQDNNSKLLFNILRLTSCQKDSLSWRSIFHITPGIGPKAVNEIYERARELSCQFGEVVNQEHTNGFQNISTNKANLTKCINKTLQFIDKLDIPEETKWGAWIIDQIKLGNLPAPAPGVEELLQKIDTFKEDSDPLTLDQYINQIEPLTKDIMNSKNTGRIRVMSITQSKGLTVQATIIAGVEDGILPHIYGDRQEERRLLYVGMTRAREYLILTRCRRRTGPTARSGQTNVGGTRQPSPFLLGGPVKQIDGEKVIEKLKS